MFYAQPEIKLFFQKKANHITEVKCSCKKKLCEHLAAAIFYFQKELQPDISTAAKSTNSFKLALTELKKQVKGNEDEVVLTSRLKNYCNQTQKKERFVLLLASVCLLTERLATTRHSTAILNEEVKNAIKLLESYNLNKLNLQERDALISAELLLLSNYKKFETSVYSFLLPLCVAATGNKLRVQEIRHELAKRNARQLFPGNINRKIVSIVLLEMSEERKHSDWSLFSEYYIALFEYYQCSKNEIKADDVLKSGFEKLKKSKPANFVAFLEYAMENSSHNKKTQWFYTKQVMLYSPQIPLFILQKTGDMFPSETKRKTEIDALIKQLKLDNKEASFDKIADILFYENRLGELVKEISRQKNKFWLLNKVLIKTLPETNNEWFSIYATQFGNAIAEARETHYQQYIFSYALNYIGKLKTPERKKLLEMMMEKTGRHSYIRNYILNQEML